MRIRHRFLIFLMLVSIGPLAMVSRFFLEDVGNKMNRQITDSLSRSVMIAQDSLSENLHQQKQILNLMAACIEMHSEQTLSSCWQNIPNLHGQLYDAQGHLLYRQGNLSPNVFKALVTTFTRETQKSPGYTSLMALPAQGTNPQLLEVALTRLGHASSEKILLTAIPLQQSSLFSNLRKFSPEIDFRLFVKNGSRTILTYSSNPMLESKTIQRWLTDQSSLVIFKEPAGQQVLKSTVLPVRDRLGQSVGYLVFSISNQSEIKKRYGFYVGAFLILIGLLVILTAYYFNRSVIRPVEAISQMSDKVSSGDLSVRLPEESHDEDISQLMRNLNTMLSRLEEDAALKQTFVATLTHDLRTPLYAQKRLIETFNKQGVLPESDRQQILTHIDQANEQLTEMVNKLLETYQYESGHIELQIKSIYLNDLVTRCFERLSSLASEKQIRLEKTIPENLSLEADSLQLERVFQNLISNAIANIPRERQVTVSAVMIEHCCHIKVSDNGPGIDPDLIPHLFQRYFTGHAKQKLGSGLGLFICRMIIELHGGSISAQSLPEKGTEFEIILPEQQRINI